MVSFNSITNSSARAIFMLFTDKSTVTCDTLYPNFVILVYAFSNAYTTFSNTLITMGITKYPEMPLNNNISMSIN